MPIYQFECSTCELEYEELTSYDKTEEYKSVSCPECGSSKKIKLMSVPASAIFKNPIGTDKHNNSHGFRFGHKLESAINEREMAQEKSHVGRNPYKDDPTSGTKDIDSGKYFGDVK